jgi:hypothetical protein
MKKTIGVLALFAVGSLLAVLVSTNATKAAMSGGAVPIAASIYGHFDYSIMTWAGHAFVSFNGQEPKEATVASYGTPPVFKSNGAASGIERNVLTFLDGSGTLELNVKWDGVPTSTPRVMDYHAVGTIGNGTGLYSQVSGSITSQGPFVLPLPPVMGDGTPVWISQVHGAVQGLIQ